VFGAMLALYYSLQIGSFWI